MDPKEIFLFLIEAKITSQKTEFYFKETGRFMFSEVLIATTVAKFCTVCNEQVGEQQFDQVTAQSMETK